MTRLTLPQVRPLGKAANRLLARSSCHTGAYGYNEPARLAG